MEKMFVFSSKKFAAAHFASGLMLSSPRWLHKAFVAKLTLVRPFPSVYSLVSLHVGLLDKAFATETTLMLFHIHVNLFVASEAPNRRIFFVTKFARQAFELAVGLDVCSQIPFPYFFLAYFAFRVLQSKPRRIRNIFVKLTIKTKSNLSL